VKVRGVDALVVVVLVLIFVGVISGL